MVAEAKEQWLLQNEMEVDELRTVQCLVAGFTGQVLPMSEREGERGRGTWVLEREREREWEGLSVTRNEQ